MGRVRTKTIKRASKVLLERHYQKLTTDFYLNKRILSEVAKVPTKKLRNKIAGFATHLVKRIQRGPVKGISLKIQQQERERRLDWVSKQSEIRLNEVNIDTETNKMLLTRFGSVKLLQILNQKQQNFKRDKLKEEEKEVIENRDLLGKIDRIRKEKKKIIQNKRKFQKKKLRKLLKEKEEREVIETINDQISNYIKFFLTNQKQMIGLQNQFGNYKPKSQLFTASIYSTSSASTSSTSSAYSTYSTSSTSSTYSFLISCFYSSSQMSSSISSQSSSKISSRFFVLK